jgi:hypothetical protein
MSKVHSKLLPRPDNENYSVFPDALGPGRKVPIFLGGGGDSWVVWLICYLVNLLNRSIAANSAWRKDLDGAGRAAKKFAKLEVKSRGRARDGDGWARRGGVRFVAGRAIMMVFSTFIPSIVTGDPGHPLSRVQNS